MSYKFFIDDERFPPESWGNTCHAISRSSHAARCHVESYGMPSFISFDHDLGVLPYGACDTSMLFLSWLEDQLIDGNLTFPPNFDYYVHSQNPIGKQNIIGKMDSLLKHFKGA